MKMLMQMEFPDMRSSRATLSVGLLTSSIYNSPTNTRQPSVCGFCKRKFRSAMYLDDHFCISTGEESPNGI